MLETFKLEKSFKHEFCLELIGDVSMKIFAPNIEFVHSSKD